MPGSNTGIRPLIPARSASAGVALNPALHRLPFNIEQKQCRSDFWTVQLERSTRSTLYQVALARSACRAGVPLVQREEARGAYVHMPSATVQRDDATRRLPSDDYRPTITMPHGEARVESGATVPSWPWHLAGRSPVVERAAPAVAQPEDW
ncbi:hypothetical protein Q31a_12370 [Aureliella helgolandensis]|uniref:Uncharacterized protein n=1 Tax=Aureliella helgolandensis TaxID=2527968 RepID=A0A518G2X5_9BACT|nr:hypothetical protein Q31a_12370 [Aureliella helgolandensis]